MVHILHLPDLHFVKNTSSHNYQEVLLKEASEKVKGLPQGEKLLVITGDFHSLDDQGYREAEEFLKKLVSAMGLDIKQDVFVVPGGQDVGNDAVLCPLLKKEDKNWKKHQAAALVMLKNGNKDYIEERLQVFRPYSSFMQHIGIYDPALGEDYPASSHVRSWRGKLNILHLNTALVADNTEKDGQVADVDTAAAPTTWEHYYDEKVPSIAVAHNSFYDLKEGQRHDLAGAFALRKVSAYLAGDMSQAEKTPGHQMIRMESGARQGEEIPNLVAGKSTVNKNGALTEAGFCWHYWDEASDKVSVEFRRWSKDTLGKTNRTGEDGGYTMRHEKTGAPEVEDKPVTGQAALERSDPADPDEELREYLAEVIRNKRDRHPSFELLTINDIDRRLRLNIKKYELIEPRGKITAGGADPEAGSRPVWEIVRDSWNAPIHRSIVITGEGGIGKTVALFSIVEQKSLMAVPALYIPMYELVDKNGKLLELGVYIEKKYKSYGGKIDHIASEPWRERPKLLLLLDGLNEVPFSMQRDVLDTINEWHDTHPGAQLIAVSRPMDGIYLPGELAGNPIPVELALLDDGTIREYLEAVNRKCPSNKHPIWEYLRYPLFLNLYIKNRKLTKIRPAGYSLRVKDADNGGNLIWNFLQRELLRYKSDKNEKTENWVIRCAVANEYILPYLAYQMVFEQKMEISYKQAVQWVDEAIEQFDKRILPKHLKDIWNRYEEKHGSTLSKDMINLQGWRDTVLRDSGILIPVVNNNDDEAPTISMYCFMHQHFRDCLAGLYLVNQAEMAGEDNLPEVWRHGQNHLALDYAAELMDKDTADKLWETNRVAQQYSAPGYVRDPSSTFALLELQKRRKPVPQDLDFSGMDLRGMSLIRYMGIGKRLMPLFQEPRLTRGTRLDQSTFQSEGHVSGITCLLVLPDGRVVSGSTDTTLRVWDPMTGNCLQVLKGHAGVISCLVAVKDGRAVSGSLDNTMRVWNLSTGQCLQVMEGYDNWFRRLVTLPDGRIVSNFWDDALRIWDPSSGKCIQALKGHSHETNGLAVLPDGRVVSGSLDNTLRVWDPMTGECLQVLEGHAEAVICLMVFEDGRVVSGSLDGTLRVWDPDSGKCLQVLKGHAEAVRCLAVLEDGRVVSGSLDNTLRVWDPDSGKCLQVLKGHAEAVNCLAVLSDERVVSGSKDDTLRVWNLSSGECLQVLKGHGYNVNCLAVLPDKRVVSGMDDGTLCVWDPLIGECLQVLEGHANSVSRIAVLPDGRIVSGFWDGALRIWDSTLGRCEQILKEYGCCARSLTVFSDGRVASGSENGIVHVWDTTTGECLHVLEGNGNWVSCLAALPDGRVASGSDDGIVRVWDATTGECLKVLEGNGYWVRCLAALPDGRIVNGSADGSLKIWDPMTGECLQVLKGHAEAVSCLAVLPDGRIVSGADDGIACVWDATAGRYLRVLKKRIIWGTCLAALPDGRIASGLLNGSLHVWDATTGEDLRVLKEHENWIHCLGVLPDGRIVSGSYDGTLRFWDTSTWSCIKTIRIAKIDVSQMNLSSAILTEDLAKILWQNGAKIPKADFEKYILVPSKE